MSGILALLSLDGRPIGDRLPRAALEAIEHRGDREPRLWESDGVALGHANHPTTHEAEREQLPAPDVRGRWMTWDGRVDNRSELARSLRLDPGRAASMTDADFVLAAYA